MSLAFGSSFSFSAKTKWYGSGANKGRDVSNAHPFLHSLRLRRDIHLCLFFSTTNFILYSRRCFSSRTRQAGYWISYVQIVSYYLNSWSSFGSIDTETSPSGTERFFVSVRVFLSVFTDISPKSPISHNDERKLFSKSANRYLVVYLILRNTNLALSNACQWRTALLMVGLLWDLNSLRDCAS